jgi:hypothetical protein
MILGVVAALGLCSAAVLWAVNFQLVQVISSADIQKASWPSSSVTWSLGPDNLNVDSSGGGSVTAALTSAFTAWQGVTYSGTWQGSPYTSAALNTLAFTQGAGSLATDYNGADCVNTLGFDQELSTGIVALTGMTYAVTITPGSPAGNYTCTAPPTTRTCPNQVCIIDADVEFSTRYRFSTYAGAPSTEYDLQTVATHEIGHMIGLDHSGIAHAVMFPYGDTTQIGTVKTLTVDDEIGSGVLYPTSASQSLFGTINGTVTVGDNPAFGTHVVAIDSTTGNAITDTLSDPNGNYTLTVVEGSYYVLVLPLASDTSGDSSTNGVTGYANYSGWANGYPSLGGNDVQYLFTGTYY